MRSGGSGGGIRILDSSPTVRDRRSSSPCSAGRPTRWCLTWPPGAPKGLVLVFQTGGIGATGATPSNFVRSVGQ